MKFDKLYNIVSKSTNLKSSDKSIMTFDIHSKLIKNEEVRDILEIENPIVENISDTLELSKGKVHAVRLDKSYGITGFKKPVIASLILKRIIEAAKRKDYNKKWIDGGNVNSSLALAYFAKKFSGEATYIMSRFFPEYVLNYIKEVSQNSIQLIKAPNLKLGVERDFYQYLLSLVRSNKDFKSHQPLWHAKYSGEYTQFMGEELLESLNFHPDFIVLVLGAGSTLEGQAVPIKLKSKSKSKIIVPEHCQSPLLNVNQIDLILNKISGKTSYSKKWFSNPPNGIPHYVIGPHYDEINPLIKKSVISQIDSVFRYDDVDWKEMSYKCYKNDLKIGNSSAANLFVAKQLANKGHNVLTFIYEPFRSFYHGHNVVSNKIISKDFSEGHIKNALQMT